MMAKFTEITQLLDRGQFPTARKSIQHLAKKRWARVEALELATQARRVGLPEVGVRLLAAYVRPSGRRVIEPLPAEKVMYGACLIRLGAVREAESILKSVEKTSVAEVDLFLAFCAIVQWDYAQAITLLGRYLKDQHLTPYQRTMAEVNLLAALVHERKIGPSRQLLSRLLPQTLELGYSVLHGNCLELEAQLSIESGDYPHAHQLLANAEKFLQDAHSVDAFFIKKWKALLELKQRGPGKSQLRQIQLIKQEANSRSHWETLRDCDRHLAIQAEDSALFLKVYFGTPFLAFKKQIKSDFNSGFNLPEFYEWKPLGDYKGACALDLVGGSVLGKWKQGTLIVRALQTLSRDFYRPTTLAGLYSELYPNEYFNTRSSPERIYQLLKRVRETLVLHKVPIRVHTTRGGYRLIFFKPVTLKVRSQYYQYGMRDAQISLLKERIGNPLFKTKEVVSTLNVPQRTANRLIRHGLEAGSLEQVGNGCRALYRFS